MERLPEALPVAETQHVGKSDERDQSFAEWKALLRRTLPSHAEVIKSDGFVAIHIAGTLCFADVSMTRLMAEYVSRASAATSRAS